MKQFIQKLAEKNLFLKEVNGDLILNGKKEKLSKEDILAIKNDYTIVDFIKKHKEALIDYLRTNATNSKSENISSIYGLSPMQEGMLFHELFDSTSVAYTNQMVMDFPDGLDLEAFKSACNYVLKNHSILRTAFFYENLSIPIQSVYKKVEMPITIIDFSQLSEEEQEKTLQKAIAKDLHTGFDLTVPPLMRFKLFKINGHAYQMIWTHHHIIIDGWSMPIIMGELLKAYDIYKAGNEPEIPKEDQYKDYIDYITSKDKKEETTYWETYLETLEEGSLLPFVENNVARNTGVGEFQNEKLLFDIKATKKITAFCQLHHLTTNTLVQGVWSYLLSRYTGKNDVVFGVTVSGRPSDLEDTEERVGLYINTLPLYVSLKGNQSILDFLKTIQRDQTAAREYQYSALSSVKKWGGIQGEFFDSLLVYESYPTGDLDLQEISTKSSTIEVLEKTNYLLTFKISLGTVLGIDLGFNASLLDVKHVRMIKEHFEIALLEFINNAEKSILEVNYLTEKEKQVLIGGYNRTEVLCPKEKTVIDLFKAQVFKTPEAIAVVYEDTALTYKELDERSNQLANYLAKQNLQSESYIPLCLHRSVEMIIGILGVLKAGYAYVPIDPTNPQARIDFILSDISAEIVLTESSLENLFSEVVQTVFSLDRLVVENESTTFETNINEHQLAYVIYTSGTTGVPKGVMIEHKSLNNFLNGFSELYSFS
ncbi:condensation domain-containing protein, partial [Snuella sedimenti]